MQHKTIKIIETTTSTEPITSIEAIILIKITISIETTKISTEIIVAEITKIKMDNATEITTTTGIFIETNHRTYE